MKILIAKRKLAFIFYKEKYPCGMVEYPCLLDKMLQAHVQDSTNN